ncbi:MAG: tRNA (adenosine(37)-N6)-dimethylallyltransferase MiaA, partial [Desulfobacterales bacterium]
MHNGIVKPKIIVICGPTALGKTAVAIDIARLFSGEIIGADSMQVYRHMNIGTAKPTPGEQACVPHHLIDIIDPDEWFDAKRFAKMAYKKILDLHHRGITPFVVGGTGLYIKALIYGLFEADTTDLKVRTRLKKEVKDYGSHIL